MLDGIIGPGGAEFTPPPLIGAFGRTSSIALDLTLRTKLASLSVEDEAVVEARQALWQDWAAARGGAPAQFF